MKVFLKICFEPRFCPFLGCWGLAGKSENVKTGVL